MSNPLSPCGGVYAHLAHTHVIDGTVYWCAGYHQSIATPEGKPVTTDKQEGRALDADQVEKDLSAWWLNTAEREIRQTVPKAVEYGGAGRAADLPIIGQAMMSLNPDAWAGADANEREKIGNELGIAFYTLGKVARLFGAYSQGKLPADDTWFDIGVYTKMAQRNRDRGGWPV